MQIKRLLINGRIGMDMILKGRMKKRINSRKAEFLRMMKIMEVLMSDIGVKFQMEMK